MNADLFSLCLAQRTAELAHSGKEIPASADVDRRVDYFNGEGWLALAVYGLLGLMQLDDITVGITHEDGLCAGIETYGAAA